MSLLFCSILNVLQLKKTNFSNANKNDIFLMCSHWMMVKLLNKKVYEKNFFLTVRPKVLIMYKKLLQSSYFVVLSYRKTKSLDNV